MCVCLAVQWGRIELTKIFKFIERFPCIFISLHRLSLRAVLIQHSPTLVKRAAKSGVDVFFFQYYLFPGRMMALRPCSLSIAG